MQVKKMLSAIVLVVAPLVIGAFSVMTPNIGLVLAALFFVGPGVALVTTVLVALLLSLLQFGSNVGVTLEPLVIA